MKNLPVRATLVIFTTVGTALWFYPQYAWAHPLLQILLLQMRLLHIHTFRDIRFVGRNNLMCSGT